MAQQFQELTDPITRFIENQHIFFVGTAATDGKVNVSPKGCDSLRIINSNKVVWLNLTGSGNESAAHILDNNRMTLMFCSFDKKPLILRLYGKAVAIHPRDQEKWQQYSAMFPELPGIRQFFELNIDLVQTSCGMAVPFFEHVSDREALNQWAVQQGNDGIKKYWHDRNQKSIDSLDTHILD